MNQDDKQRHQQVQGNQQYQQQFFYQQPYPQQMPYIDPSQYQYYYQQQMNPYQQQQYGRFPQQQGQYQMYPQQQQPYQHRQKHEKRHYDKSTLESPPSIEYLRATYPPLAEVNTPTLNPEDFSNAQFVILRSSSFDNIHKAMKHGVWTSTSRTNCQLHNSYLLAKEQGKQVILLYTVVGSHSFQGAARLLGPFDPQATFYYWDEPFKWLGSFPLSWIFVSELSQKQMDDLYQKLRPKINQVAWTDQVDCSEIPSDQGVFILKCFKDTLENTENKILQQFPLFNKREDDIRLERDMNPAFIEQMTHIQREFELEPFKQRQRKPNRNYNQQQFSNQEQMMYYSGYNTMMQTQQQQPQYDTEEQQPSNIEQRFYVKPQKLKKPLKEKKPLKLSKKSGLSDYQQDPNAVVPSNVQQDSSDSEQKEVQE